MVSDADKAHSLNSYFASTFTVENQDSFQTNVNSFPDMPDILVTEPGVLKLLSSLDAKKSMGPDNISPLVLKEARNEIAGILTFIFNQSLSSGQVPDDWRLANVFPLYKKGAKDLPENYRPVSLTSVWSKLLEHIVHSSVCQFLEENHVLTPCQHGVRQKYSCDTAGVCGQRLGHVFEL